LSAPKCITLTAILFAETGYSEQKRQHR